tara:strand:- start:10 stop:450 length:441 start_codon:yes stop_codon:yes gene_type:complete
MALVGGGGAPNVGGGSAAGVGSGINFLRYPEKTLAYAYSGSVTVNGTDIVALNFSTGNESIDAKLMVQFMQSAADGDDSVLSIELNGEQIGGSYIAADFGGTNVLGPENWIPVIIPPYSTFKCLFTMISGSGSIDLGVTLIGDVYA